MRRRAGNSRLACWLADWPTGRLDAGRPDLAQASRALTPEWMRKVASDLRPADALGAAAKGQPNGSFISATPTHLPTWALLALFAAGDAAVACVSAARARSLSPNSARSSRLWLARSFVR